MRSLPVAATATAITAVLALGAAWAAAQATTPAVEAAPPSPGEREATKPPATGVPAAPVPRRDFAAKLAALGLTPSAEQLRAYHDLLGSEPHIAGTPGDARTIERLASAFTEMGLPVRIEPFWALLSEPIEANLEIVGLDEAKGAVDGFMGDRVGGDDALGGPLVGADAPEKARPARRGVLALPLRERNLLEDPATAHPDLTWGWNAYAASGEVEAGVVFAHRGTKADFARLREMGVSCRGRIVLIRYGGIFRGSKVRNAEDAGAAAVLLYTDPADTGDARGPVWPDGGWANDFCVQRGSVAALDAPGDPLTPFQPAVPGVKRLEVDQVRLPRIPVQPIGYAAAMEIMSRMRGPEIAEDDPWHGGMRVAYRVGDGEQPRLRLKVVQQRVIRESANVIAAITGKRTPEQAVIVGCHHDAWGFGAADPLAGTIVLLETARLFAEAAKQGLRPDRSIIFAAWGAEEFGIIGSVEWVEAHREAIAREAIAYINLDMAAMGPRMAASASPSLKPLVQRLTGVETVADPGGGSDHTGFLHHLAIPCITLAAYGSPGDAYHSNYDTLEWYRRVVGDDYASAVMVTNATVAITAALADAPLLPLRAEPIGRSIVRWIEGLRERTEDPGVRRGLDALAMRGESIAELGALIDARLESALDSCSLDDFDRSAIDGLLMGLDRSWYDRGGLDSRPWYRNLSLATDRESRYGALPLPLVSEAIDSRDPARISLSMERTADAMDSIMATLQAIESKLGEIP